MFEIFFGNQGFKHITENILIKLDVQSLWKCRLVCKGLHKFITSLEKSRKVKANDFKIIQSICWRKFLAHSNWKAVFNSIWQEDNFYRRRGLLDLLENYNSQNKILYLDGSIVDSYLNTIYGTLERLKFFWPYLSNKNPKINDRKCTPFHFVANQGLINVAIFMVEEIQDDILQVCVWDGLLNDVSKNGHADIIRSLQRKVNFEVILPSLFNGGLLKAIEYGQLECVKALLENRTSQFKQNLANQHIKNYMNAVNTAKHYYAICRFDENRYNIVQYLSQELNYPMDPTISGPLKRAISSIPACVTLYGPDGKLSATTIQVKKYKK